MAEGSKARGRIITLALIENARNVEAKGIIVNPITGCLKKCTEFECMHAASLISYLQSFHFQGTMVVSCHSPCTNHKDVVQIVFAEEQNYQNCLFRLFPISTSQSVVGSDAS
jgi:hypothetical protein